MPELGTLSNGSLSIPQTSILPPSSYFDRTPIPAPVADTSRLAKAQGKAALFGSIAETLAKLPDTLISAYQAGKKMATGNQTVNAYNAALAGKPLPGTSLADFKATSEGAVTFNQDKPEDAEMRRLKIEALKRQGVKQPSFYEQEAASATPGADNPTGLPQPISPSSVEPTLTPQDPDNLDYIDGYGKIRQSQPGQAPLDANGEPRLLGPDGIPKDATDEERSSLLLPKTGAIPARTRPGKPVPLSQLSSFPASGVASEDAAAIDGAATNIGRQLTGVQPESSLGVSTDAAPAAVIEPVSREAALATFGESQNPDGFSQQESGSKTIDKSTGVVTLKTDDGREYVLTPGGHGYQEVKPRGGSAPVPATIRSEAIRMGVFKDGMTGEEASKALEDAYLSKGIIPQRLLPAAESLARTVVNHPTLKHYPTIREAKEAVDAGLANPEAGGFSDMALVEGFQRMVNPGATVRAQTIQSMQDAAGFMQKLDPTFIWDKAVQGNKFNAAARERIKRLADDIYKRATANAAPQLKALGMVGRSYGLSNPEDFVNNILVMSNLVGTDGSTAAAPGTVAPSSGAALPAATVKDAQAAGIRVTSQAQYDALPSGAKYVDSNGKPGVKK